MGDEEEKEEGGEEESEAGDSKDDQWFSDKDWSDEDKGYVADMVKKVWDDEDD